MEDRTKFIYSSLDSMYLLPPDTYTTFNIERIFYDDAVLDLVFPENVNIDTHDALEYFWDNMFVYDAYRNFIGKEIYERVWVDTVLPELKELDDSIEFNNPRYFSPRAYNYITDWIEFHVECNSDLLISNFAKKYFDYLDKYEDIINENLNNNRSIKSVDELVICIEDYLNGGYQYTIDICYTIIQIIGLFLSEQIIGDYSDAYIEEGVYDALLGNGGYQDIIIYPDSFDEDIKLMIEEDE